MKQLILTLSTLILTTFMSLGNSAENNDIVRIARLVDITADPSPPLRWLECNDSNRSTGSITHLLETIFRDLNKNIEWVVGSNTLSSNKVDVDKKYKQLELGDFDFMITRNPTADYSFDTLNALIATKRISLITTISNPVYKGDIKSLTAYSGGIRYFSSLSNAIHDYLKLNNLPAKTYENNNDVLTALISKDVDYVITEYFTGKEWTHNHKIKDQLVFHDIEIEGPSIYLLSSTHGKHANLISNINQKLKELNDSGFIERLNQYYLSQWLSQPCAHPHSILLSAPTK